MTAVPDLLRTGPDGGEALLLLAHGAGAPMTSPFMDKICALLPERGLATVRFEFAYMAARRATGKRRPPPRAETLVGEYRAAIAAVRATLAAGQRLLIGGKSMGGRVASLVAAEPGAVRLATGLVVLGYPFHPPAKPEQLRTAHLETLALPALILQGERDPFGSRAEVEAMSLAPAIRLHWLGDGDHDFGPRGASGFTRRGNLEQAAAAIVEFARTSAATA